MLAHSNKDLSPLTSTSYPPPPPLPSSSFSCLWGQQHWRTRGISHHLREEANPLCPNFNWASNPPGLSKQWAPSAADKWACPPPCSLLSRAGLGPASVTVSRSGTSHLHRKCELLAKWLACLQRVCWLLQISLHKAQWQPNRILSQQLWCCAEEKVDTVRCRSGVKTLLSPE